MPDDEKPKRRKKSRRTRHAAKRSEEGRPVAQALGDVQNARKADMFIDQREGTYIVRGPKTREHVFSIETQQVTSIFRAKKAHLQRLRNGTIRPVTQDEFERFKEQF